MLGHHFSGIHSAEIEYNYCTKECFSEFSTPRIFHLHTVSFTFASSHPSISHSYFVLLTTYNISIDILASIKAFSSKIYQLIVVLQHDDDRNASGAHVAVFVALS